MKSFVTYFHINFKWRACQEKYFYLVVRWMCLWRRLTDQWLSSGVISMFPRVGTWRALLCFFCGHAPLWVVMGIFEWWMLPARGKLLQFAMSCWLCSSQLESIYLHESTATQDFSRGAFEKFFRMGEKSSFQCSQVSEKQPTAIMWTLLPSKREHEGCSLAPCRPNGRRLSMSSANPVTYSRPLLRHNHCSPGKRRGKSPEVTDSKFWPFRQIGTQGGLTF